MVKPLVSLKAEVMFSSKSNVSFFEKREQWYSEINVTSFKETNDIKLDDFESQTLGVLTMMNYEEMVFPGVVFPVTQNPPSGWNTLVPREVGM